ncbi:phage holin family protein [Pseudomonas sp. PDM31]|nr:phage holin family protein [Pseudomonas sp. PDM31]MBV7480623.1 phage holin family protein [Pseudomonas sp. PDM31]
MGNQAFALVFITAIAHLLSAFRLACYQRDELRHCWRDRLLTSLCGGLFCVAGMDVLLTSVPVSPWHSVVSILLCVLIIRNDGNIAVLWRAPK